MTVSSHLTDLMFRSHYILFAIYHIQVFISITVKNVKIIPDYISRRMDIAAISGAWAATVCPKGQNSYDKGCATFLERGFV